jgi:hypothetical protein
MIDVITRAGAVARKPGTVSIKSFEKKPAIHGAPNQSTRPADRPRAAIRVSETRKTRLAPLASPSAIRSATSREMPTFRPTDVNDRITW